MKRLVLARLRLSDVAALYIVSLLSLTLLFLIPFYRTIGSVGLPSSVLYALVLFISLNQAVADTFKQHLLLAWPERVLPCLDQAGQINARISCYHIIVPTLLISEESIGATIKIAELNLRHVNDIRARFVILADHLDGDNEVQSEAEAGLLAFIRAEVDRLNRIYGRGGFCPFILMSRPRRFAPSEGVWMGWERKIGKIISFFEFVCTGHSELTILSGQAASDIRSGQYAIVIDDDNVITPGSAQSLIGCIAHPANQPVLDGGGSQISSGYGIIMPLNHQRTMMISSRNTGFDLFGETKFIGKGAYNIGTCYRILKHGYVEGRILSHDTWESLLIRTGFTNRAAVIENVPSTQLLIRHRGYRWTRGDWQNFILMVSLFWRGHRFSAVGWMSILRDVRQSVFPLSFCMALLVIALVGTTKDLLLYILMINMPNVIKGIRGIAGIAWKGTEVAAGTFKQILIVVLVAAFDTATALSYAILNTHAIFRTVLNSVRRRRLLIWTSFSQLENAPVSLNPIVLSIYLSSIVSVLALLFLIYSRTRYYSAAMLLLVWSAAPAGILRINRSEK